MPAGRTEFRRAEAQVCIFLEVVGGGGGEVGWESESSCEQAKGLMHI
jgi:hypothetical protein